MSSGQTKFERYEKIHLTSKWLKV